MASPSIHRIERLNYGIGAVLTLAALATQDKPIAMGVAVGVALTCLNFFALRKLIVKWTRDAKAGVSGSAPLLMLPKMAGLMGLVAAAVLLLPIDVVAFTVGYSIFFISIVIEASYTALKTPAGSDGTEANE